MGETPQIRCLFLDIGGVLLSDGWGRDSRKKAVSHFQLDAAEMEDRHLLTWNTYQEGKLTLDDYLSRVVFYKEQPFHRDRFRDFIFAQTAPYPDMIDLVGRLKSRYGLKVGVVSNEGRELNAYRIGRFELTKIVDFFISSCFVGRLKPDVNIFRLALDIGQVAPHEAVYIENTPMFVDIAEGLGIRGIRHRDYATTRATLASFGLE